MKLQNGSLEENDYMSAFSALLVDFGYQIDWIKEYSASKP
jgi:hypothetical protein